MSTGAINFNDEAQFISELSIFNEGNAGIVENVEIRVNKKGPDEAEKLPVYKIIAKDKYGELNEGFFYYESLEEDGFKKYQAQRLIRLAKGILGDDIEFPPFATPKEALDHIMAMVAKGSRGKLFRVAICYGTTKRPEKYLRFKSFRRFIESMDIPFADTQLKLEAMDNTVRKQETPTTEEEVNSLIMPTATSTGTANDDDDLPWDNPKE